ncbi:hypothetical protein LY78DRAFT_219999 [Colletotrichum sublineola]|nr:hypothetical protein LY78DRAFT_219999 [Colletotrichum sublineola]
MEDTWTPQPVASRSFRRSSFFFLCMWRGEGCFLPEGNKDLATFQRFLCCQRNKSGRPSARGQDKPVDRRNVGISWQVRGRESEPDPGDPSDPLSPFRNPKREPNGGRNRPTYGGGVIVAMPAQPQPQPQPRFGFTSCFLLYDLISPFLSHHPQLPRKPQQRNRPSQLLGWSQTA